ncbi:hypothetical protein KAT92_02880 [Candidatus Babeliales bacterium]|nr:hypothetical protein [Candidatus Babeliales bacterium]
MNFINRDKEWFISCLENKPLVEKLKKINLIITDIDGCLTDGSVYYLDSQEIQKGFSIQDGFMMAKCNKPGMPHLALLSGRSDKSAKSRAKTLGIPDDLYYEGFSRGKTKAVLKIQEKLNIKKEETIFFGDDLLDLETKENITILASPTNALFYIHENSEIIVPRSGGNGAMRLLLDLILYAQERHPAQEIIKNALK